MATRDWWEMRTPGVPSYRRAFREQTVRHLVEQHGYGEQEARDLLAVPGTNRWAKAAFGASQSPLVFASEVSQLHESKLLKAGLREAAHMKRLRCGICGRKFSPENPKIHDGLYHADCAARHFGPGGAGLPR